MAGSAWGRPSTEPVTGGHHRCVCLCDLSEGRGSSQPGSCSGVTVVGVRLPQETTRCCRGKVPLTFSRNVEFPGFNRFLPNCHPTVDQNSAGLSSLLGDLVWALSPVSPAWGAGTPGSCRSSLCRAGLYRCRCVGLTQGLRSRRALAPSCPRGCIPLAPSHPHNPLREHYGLWVKKAESRRGCGLC